MTRVVKNLLANGEMKEAGDVIQDNCHLTKWKRE